MKDIDHTLPLMIKQSSVEYPDTPAQISVKNRRSPSKKEKPELLTITFRELYEIILDVAAGLNLIGVARGEPVALICDNRAEWLHANMGILAIGAVDVPRGCDATPIDLQEILGITECRYCVAENSAQVNKILKIITGTSDVSEITATTERVKLPNLSSFVVIDQIDEATRLATQALGMQIHAFTDVAKNGKSSRVERPGFIEEELLKGKPTDTASLIFTSGTTGTPKGVELTHGNYLAQLDELPERIILLPGDHMLSVLPVWHVFERSCEYVVLVQGATLCYSKPIAQIMLADMLTYNPVLLPAVPRIFEGIYDGVWRKMRQSPSIVCNIFKFFFAIALIHSRMHRRMFRQNVCFTRYYTGLWWVLFIIPWTILWPLKLLGNILVFHKIKAMLGRHFRYGVVGGGAFPRHIDEFFWAIGVKIVEGYGLTETSPIISVRHVSCPVFGCVGSPLRRLVGRVVSLEDGFVLPRGKFGIIQVKGDTVMKGYYKRPDATAKVLSDDGWLDTGDLGYMSIHDEIVIKGRKKDTIVLRGGENVEPVPIEETLTRSRFIKQAVVVGQDEKYLGALILVAENELRTYAAEIGLQYPTYDELLKSPEVHALYETEIATLVNSRNGFKMYERINKFALLTKEFQVGVELSAKQEIMRYRLCDIYKDEVKSIFSE